MSNNNVGHRIVKKIVKITKINEDKKIKQRCELKNKLIIFIYHLKLFFTLSTPLNSILLLSN